MEMPIAGTGTIGGVDGDLSTATLAAGITVDASGNICCEANGGRLRKIDAGEINWSDPGALLGDFPVTLTVDDGKGGSNEQTFTITVQHAIANYAYLGYYS